jgi:hypothetical protein
MSLCKQKLIEKCLSILGKRKISVLNFNLDEFRQGLNWAYALAADAFGQLTKITGNWFLSWHIV